MGFLKKLGVGLVAVLAAVCLFVFLCAVNPDLTQSISSILYGEDGSSGLIGGKVSRDTSAAALPAGVSPTATIPGQTSGGTAIADLVPYTPYNGTITTIPENVSGRTGFVPVTGVQEQLSDAQAKEAAKTVEKGSTGSDLEFDPTFYPYYSMLDEKTQSLYRQIYANACDVVSSFAPCVEVKTDQVQNAFEAVFADHPELFYVQTAYTEKYTKDGKVVEIDMAYYTIANDLETARQQFEAAAQSIEESARQYPDDYSREKFVHDALIEKVVYDTAASLDQSAYGALVNGRCVCAGYSRGFQYVMQKLGIPTYYVTGSSGEDHAWNIVGLGDGFYNVDVTWDDAEPASYDYFNKTDGDYAGTHVRKSLSVYLPACTGTQYRNLESGAPVQGEGEETQTADAPAGSSDFYDPYFDPYINNDPGQPLSYDKEHPVKTEDDKNKNNNQYSSNAAQQLEALGLKESDALKNLQDYYADCKKQLVSCGKGDHTFYNLVPDTLFKTIESEYGTGKYRTGYLDSALKTIGAENCNIVIQAERVGGGYYRIWHNVYVW